MLELAQRLHDEHVANGKAEGERIVTGRDGRHGHGRLCLDRRYRGGGGGGDRSPLAELGDSAVGGLELGLEVGVLSLQLTHRLDYLVEELVDLVLLVALTELGRLELLVEDVVCCQQRHGRHLGVVTDKVTSTGHPVTHADRVPELEVQATSSALSHADVSTAL